jgi:pilus assembly protein CpaC
MRSFIAILILILATSATAGEPVRLDLGEDYILKIKRWSPLSKVWIENKEVLQFEQTGLHLVFKAVRTGTSYLRIGQDLRQITVSRVGTKSALKLFSELTSPSHNLSLNYCRQELCLNGSIRSFDEYLKIRAVIKKLQIPLTVSVQIPDDFQPLVKKKMSEELRAHGLTPQKIILDGVWRSYTGLAHAPPELLEQLRSLGVRLYRQDKINQMADNVAVTVRIVEVNKNLVRKLGLMWPDQYQAQVLNFKQINPVDQFDLFLAAEENKGQARVLASPRLTCRSGELASFFAGGEFPVKVNGLRSNYLSWKRYGIGLNLKPRIDALGQLNLQIETEISSVDHSLKIDDLPGVMMSKVSSYFDMIDRKTISLSGLVKSEKSQSESGLPYLKDIPILGELFKSRSFIENKTELIIFVTPQLVKTEEDSK